MNRGIGNEKNLHRTEMTIAVDVASTYSDLTTDASNCTDFGGDDPREEANQNHVEHEDANLGHPRDVIVAPSPKQDLLMERRMRANGVHFHNHL